MVSIANISTPIGSGGISIIRISGDDSLKILCDLTNKKTDFFEPRKMMLTKIEMDGISEKALCVFFEAPRTYTGENMVEIHCHGGIFITNKILRKVIELGARLGEAGEFSKRAFMNGKMTLDECEGVIDLINAESSLSAKVSGNLVTGKLKKKVEDLQKKLTDLSAKVEVALDYPEYDEETILEEEIYENIDEIKKEVNKIVEDSSETKIISNGIKIALVGVPNVGKSSLLNALLDYDKAIVTDEAGTTRDVVEGSEIYKGIKFNYVDTAGIRETENKVEKIGVQKSRDLIENSDIVLNVFSSEDDFLPQTVNNLINVQNKIDINPVKCEKADICISAENKENIENLKEMIYNKVLNKKVINSADLVVNERHLEILKRVQNVINIMEKGKEEDNLECIAFNINEIYSLFGEISGITTSEDVIDAIFKKFCLGK